MISFFSWRIVFFLVFGFSCLFCFYYLPRRKISRLWFLTRCNFDLHRWYNLTPAILLDNINDIGGNVGNVMQLFLCTIDPDESFRWAGYKDVFVCVSVLSFNPLIISTEAHPEKFNSRLRNKIFYGQMGRKDLVRREWKNLSEFVTLECNGHDLTPKLKEHRVHAIVFLNIPSYGGDTRPG